MPEIQMSPQELQVFLACTQRFDDIVQKLPIKVRTSVVDYDKNYDVNKALSDQDAIHAVVRYFNLCAEEFYLNKCGLITPEVWTLWQKQIRGMFSEKFVATVWKSVKPQYEDQGDFYAFVESSLAS